MELKTVRVTINEMEHLSFAFNQVGGTMKWFKGENEVLSFTGAAANKEIFEEAVKRFMRFMIAGGMIPIPESVAEETVRKVEQFVDELLVWNNAVIEAYPAYQEWSLLDFFNKMEEQGKEIEKIRDRINAA